MIQTKKRKKFPRGNNLNNVIILFNMEYVISIETYSKYCYLKFLFYPQLLIIKTLKCIFDFK